MEERDRWDILFQHMRSIEGLLIVLIIIEGWKLFSN
jgi:hypothetical protein